MIFTPAQATEHDVKELIVYSFCTTDSKEVDQINRYFEAELMIFKPQQAVERCAHYAHLSHVAPTSLHLACFEAFLALTAKHADEDDWRAFLERSRVLLKS